MSGPEVCAHCGRTQPQRGDTPLASLSREIERIQQIAQERVRTEERRRIDELTLEIQHLRETVARLRGMAATAPARNR